MAYPKVKFDERDYSVSDDHPVIAKHQQIPEIARHKLHLIHTTVVLPLRDDLAMPYVTSAFRSPQLNLAVGSKSRQHMAGEAIDFLWPEANKKVLEAFKLIRDEMYHQTGWCYLWVDSEKKEFKHIHWALPLSPDQPPRKNPRKFWWFYEGGFHPDPPEWCFQN